MNKKELVKKVAERTETSQKKIEEFLAVSLEVIQKEVAEGGTVQLIGFGSFKSKNRAAITQRAFGSGKSYKTEVCKVPKFVQGQAFKEKVNKNPMKGNE